MLDSIPEIRKRKKMKARRARLVKIGVSIFILALVTTAALYLLGWETASSQMRRFLAGMAQETVSFQFEPGGEAFADFGGGVAVVTRRASGV